MGGSGENVVSVYERRLQQAVVGGDGGLYVVMEHMPKPKQKLRRTLHFSVWGVVGSVFSFLFPL